jgi:hypothetical protein
VTAPLAGLPNRWKDNDFVHPEELYDMCLKVVLNLLLERVQDTTPSYSMEVLTSEKGDKLTIQSLTP